MITFTIFHHLKSERILFLDCGLLQINSLYATSCVHYPSFFGSNYDIFNSHDVCLDYTTENHMFQELKHIYVQIYPNYWLLFQFVACFY